MSMRAKARILELLTVSAYPLSGARIGRICALGSYRLYLALRSLEKDGLIVGEFEDMPPPRRRLYRSVAATISEQLRGLE